jgi:hypothetical protein
VRADPAAVFEAFPVLLLRSTFEAAVPAFFPVCSFLAIDFTPDIMECTERVAGFATT